MEPAAPDSTPPKGVIPHLNFAGAWHEYPKHRWFVGTAWHYTSIEGCFGIVSNHELWASSASMLNDSGEMVYGLERMRDVASHWSRPEDSDPLAVEQLHTVLDGLERSLTENPPFVLSASKSPFLLNQWSNYGESSGCAIGFRALDLLYEAGRADRGSSGDALPLWLEVIYEPELQDAHIASLLNELVAQDKLISRAILHGYEPSLLLKQNLWMLMATLKHPGFQAESEVRFVVMKGDSTSVYYRAAPRGIVPYVKLHGARSTPEGGFQVSLDASSPLPLPIVGLHVGPPQGDSETRRVASMRDFLASRGYQVAVEGAGIPYLA